MKNVYLLVPLLAVDSTQQLEQQIEGVLNLSQNAFDIHELKRDIYCVEVAHFNLCFTEIENVFRDYEELSKKVALLDEVIQDYHFSDPRPESESINIEALLKKVKKFKEVKDENKKLKKLLQVQCENAEKMCEETHKTVKKLKEEVNALVQEVSQKEAKDLKPAKDKDRRNRKEEVVDL